MPITIPRSGSWDRQPSGLLLPRAELFGLRVVSCGLPGIVTRELVTGAAPTVNGSPTGEQKSRDGYGWQLQFHPGGGSSGYGTLNYAEDGSGDDMTMLWVGTPDNISTANGQLIQHGADGFGNGWHARLQYVNSNAIRASVVDSSPAQFDVDLTLSGLATGQHRRHVLVKRGTTLEVYDWTSRTSASGSGGNGGLRTSTLGSCLAAGGGGGAAGHQRTSTWAVLRGALPAGAVKEWLERPWMHLVRHNARLWMLPAGGGGGTAIDVGRADETDTAFALTGVQSRGVGLASETDTALARPVVLAINVGLCVEADTALALSGVHIGAVGRSNETDTALAPTGVQIRGAGRADETDTAFALSPGLGAPPGVAVETDSAFALACVQIRQVGRADEVDSAFSLTSGGTFGVSEETDTALAPTAVHVIPAGRANETDTAFALTAAQSRPPGLALETDTSFPLAPRQILPAGLCQEFDSCPYNAGGAGAGPSVPPGAHFIITTGRLMAH